METIQATQFATCLKDWKKMKDYSEYLLEINKQMQAVHKYALANNFKSASEAAARVAKYAMSLAALLEVKTATTGTVQKSVWAEIGGITRTWAALAGARAAHAAAHDTAEDENGMFNVGGEMTPYPAGPGLSAANSVNCRCFARARRAV